MASQAAVTSSTTVSVPREPWAPIAVLAFVGEIFLLLVGALGWVLRGKLNLRDTLNQMAAIGVDSMPIIIACTLSTGGVFAYYTADIFINFGATAFLGGTLTLSILLELGPVLAGVNVAARSGAAIAAEIGSMAVTEQVDALRAMAVSPVRYLVAPRLVAAILMMPLVGVFANFFAILGAYLMSRTHGVPGPQFLESARTMATEMDLFKGLVKTVVFGAIIALVSCRQGLRTSGGATGVGRSTTSSVVLCVVLIFISDFFLAQVLMGPSASRGR
jgi:phospholipid/cholesterol/gamma-HCH transport system permease protein